MKKIILVLLAGVLLYSCKKYNATDQPNNSNGAPGSPNIKLATASVDLVYRTQIYAGTGTAGQSNGSGRLSATFNVPEGVAFDSSGNMFITDRDNHCIRKITTGGTVSVFAGSTSGVAGFTNGTGTAARFHSPLKLAIDGADNIYVADRDNNVIRKITSAGVVTTLAGSSSGTAGNTDGTGSSAKFSFPVAVAVSSAGTVYVADAHNDRIRKITSAGIVTTLAGSVAGWADATGTSAKFDDPSGVALDASGNIIVADRGNSDIRKITNAGVTTTIAGIPDSSGLREGPALKGKMAQPYGVAVAADGAIFISDIGNHTIRRLNTDGELFTVGGMGTAGDDNGDFSMFNTPSDIAIDATGNLYVADLGNDEIRILSSITTRRLRNTLGWSSTTVQTGLTWYKFNSHDYFYMRYGASLDSVAVGPQNVNVLDVDLNSFKLVVVHRADNNPTNVRNMGLSVTNAVAALNGAYGEHYTISGAEAHDSFLRGGGTTYWHVGIPSTDTYRWYKHWGAFYYDDATLATGFLQDKTSADPYFAETYPTIVSGFPTLLTGGVVTGNSEYGSPGSYRYTFSATRYARTAIARSANNHILFITFDMPNSYPNIVGINTGDEARFILDYFGYQDALNIDGGYSTTMWIKNQGAAIDSGVVNIPCYNRSNNAARQSSSLLNAIAIVPKP